MPEIVEKYAEIIQDKGLTPYAAHKAAKIIYESLFIEPASPGKLWYNHDAAESFVPTLRLMSWKWLKALVKGRLPAFAGNEKRKGDLFRRSRLWVWQYGLCAILLAGLLLLVRRDPEYFFSGLSVPGTK